MPMLGGWLMKPSRRGFLLGLLLLSFGLRVGAVLALRDVHVMHAKTTAGADAIEFDQLARRLEAGQGYTYDNGAPTAFRAPGFPMALALVYAVNQSYLAGYLFQCVIGALGVGFAYLMAREVMGEWAARVAGLIAAFYFGHLYLSTVFLSEALFAATITSACWLYLIWLRTSRWPLLLVSALLLGFAVLVRPVAELVICILGILLLTRRQYGAALAFVVIAAAPVVPWLMRNHSVWGHYVMTTNGGATLYGGNNDLVSTDPDLLGGWVSTTRLPGRNLVDAAPNEYAHDRVEWELGRRWMTEHADRLPLLWVEKFVRLWAPDISSGNKKALLLSVISYVPVLLLMLVACPVLWRRENLRNERWFVVHASSLATIAVALLFWGSPRFRDANAPMLSCYAAVGVSVIVKRTWRPSLEPACAVH